MTGDAIVRVNLENLALMRFDVELFGIPYSPDFGHEVTVNFWCPGLNNNGTFYSDANGLQMQKRVLNHRDTWDLQLAPWMNITANYFPVASAIAAKDLNRKIQMTVMNDRTEGGSVIKNGRIELMQNRRMNGEDGKGVGEALNETDSAGNGISVPATYYVQLFNFMKRESLQRTMQQRQDQPAQYFFSFNTTQSDSAAPSALVTDGIEEILASSNMTHQMKLELFTLGKNKIMMRVENLADVLDDLENSTIRFQTVNVEDVAHKLFGVANKGDFGSLDSISVEEMNLTGNQKYSDMAAKRLSWIDRKSVV